MIDTLPLKKLVFYTLMLLWVSIMIFVLIDYLENDLKKNDSEIYLLFFLKLATLSFLFGPLFVTIFGLVASQVGFLVDFWDSFSDLQQVTFVWIGMFVFGFLQWFVILPKLTRVLLVWLSTKRKSKDIRAD